MTVRIVTDSTCDIPADVARDLGIAVVPQYVEFGGQLYRDNVDITADQFYSRLAAGPALPRTSPASPGEFKEVFDAAGEDADGIVCIHISSKLSSATQAAVASAVTATTAPCPLEVIDSYQGSMGLGLTVMAAAEAANRGEGLGEVAAAARDAASRVRLFVLFETLEYLYRGGRIGKAQSLMASLLSIKPMATIEEGEVHPMGKVRTFRKGLLALEKAVRDCAPLASLSVMHSTTPDAAADFCGRIRHLLPDGADPHIARFGPVVGTYAGPGALGVALLPAR